MVSILSFWHKWQTPERAAGYVTDQNGIMTRYRREQANWEPHLTKCHQTIETFVTHTQAQNIAILGSGWLLDIPLEALVAKGCHITLYDICHPAVVLHKYKNTPNVHFAKCDLTGGTVQLAVNATTFPNFCTLLTQVPQPFNTAEYDAIISVNLLNQLDILLCDYLKDKFSVTQDKLSAIRQTIQQNHVTWLKAGKALIITDVTELSITIRNKIAQTNPLVFAHFDGYKKLDHWTWLFDTNQRYQPGFNTHFRVEAWCNT